MIPRKSQPDKETIGRVGSVADYRYQMWFPDCGCPQMEACGLCPTCGSCVRNKEYCPCLTVRSDEQIGFEMFYATSGG